MLQSEGRGCELFLPFFSHYFVKHFRMEEKMKINGRGSIIILCGLLSGGMALGQTSANSSVELTDYISAGDQVRITDNQGRIIKGKIEQISPDSLMLKGRSTALSGSAIRQIQKRRKDPWWNGLLVGGIVGTVSGLLIAKSQCTNDSECGAIAMVVFVPAGAAIGMVTGAVIDRSVSKYDTVFTGRVASSQSGFQVSPIISQSQRGLSLSITF